MRGKEEEEGNEGVFVEGEMWERIGRDRRVTMAKDYVREQDRNISIGSREQKLFQDLYDHHFLDVDYIMQRIYVREDGSPLSYPFITRCLRLLERDGYIRSFAVAVENAIGRSKKVFALARKGQEEVNFMAGETLRSTPLVSGRTPLFIYHALRVAHLRAAFEGSQSPYLDTAFVGFLGERDSFSSYGMNKKDVIRPDGTLIFRRTLENGEVFLVYYLEMERSRQKPQINQDKVKRYVQYIRKGQAQHHLFDLGVLPLKDSRILQRVLMVGDRDNEIKSLMNHIQPVSTEGIDILFTTYDELLRQPYERIWRADGADAGVKYHLFNRIEKQKK